MLANTTPIPPNLEVPAVCYVSKRSITSSHALNPSFRPVKSDQYRTLVDESLCDYLNAVALVTSSELSQRLVTGLECLFLPVQRGQRRHPVQDS